MEENSRDHHHAGNQSSCFCFEWLLSKIITILLNFNILFGAILILLCGAAQSGTSMLITVCQGVGTVVLSQEILTDVRKIIMPVFKVKLLFVIGISYTMHYFMLDVSGKHLKAKCNQLCSKYFNEIAEQQQLNEVFGSKDSTDNNFNSMQDCELRCVLSNDLYKYILVVIGLFLLTVCLLIWLYEKVSSEFMSLERKELLSQRIKIHKSNFLLM